MDVTKEISKLKDEKQAILLVHNYQRSEIQEIADILGDSLALAREAAQTDAEMIVFCGVSFMAETAKILSPEKTVLLPQGEATCPMANMVTAEELLKLKEQHPDAATLCYINTNAEVKAVCDICCTSANALKVIESLDADKIIFVPDRNLAAYCQRFTKKQIIPWEGFCYVHERYTKDEVMSAKAALPDACLIVHPECRPEVIDLADEVLSTDGMMKFAKKSEEKVFLIGTEEGLIERLQRENPAKEFYSAGNPKVCSNMKLTTLKDIYNALVETKKAIELSEELMTSARQAVERMLAVS